MFKNIVQCYMIFGLIDRMNPLSRNFSFPRERWVPLSRGVYQKIEEIRGYNFHAYTMHKLFHDIAGQNLNWTLFNVMPVSPTTKIIRSLQAHKNR